jgi:PAS domain S-box-containing protein
MLRASSLERYGFAVVAVGAALLYKLLLVPVVDEPTPFLLFSLAVVASAARGGWAPGLLAAALSLLAADYFFLEPRFAPGLAESGQLVRLALFALELVGLTWIAARGYHALRAARDPRRAQAAADVRASEERLRRLVDAGPAAIVGMDAAGAITFWNARAARLFGWTEDDVRGRDLAGLLLPASERDAWRGERERYLKTGEGAPVGRRDMRMLRRDRSDVRVDSLTVARRVDGAWEFALFLLDVTERARAEEVLRREAAFTACLATSIAPGMAAVDGQGRVRFLNPAAEQLLGVAADQARGQLLHDLVHGPDAHAGGDSGDCPLLRRLQAGEERTVDEDAFRRPDGSTVAVRWVASPMQGGGTGAVLVFEDDRRRRDLERLRQDELAREQQARREAEADVRVRDEFMATLSHELRTPLSAIVGWAHLLRSGNLEPADRDRAVETIDRSAKSQARLISDVLDVSGIITGKLRLTPEPVPLPPVVQAAVDTVRPAAEAKGVRLEVDLADPVQARVSGDANRLQQVVWNLVSNAVKFTPSGGTVHVRLAATGEEAEIVVRDEGRGITPDFLPHVFERFRQAENGAGQRGVGGLGLGLAIVRHLVELHGGTVQASSAGEGQGATFTVRLPVIQKAPAAAEAGAEEAPRAPAEPSLEGVRVLVVDDDADVRGMMETVLSERGARVTAAASAGEALDSVTRETPDVLLSDLAMPEMDGYELLRELRGRADAMRIPAAAVTAYARAEDRRQALLAGFQMHVAKPIEPDELVAVVASLAKKI